MTDTITSQLGELPPASADRAAVAMFTAHRVNDMLNSLAHAEERMQAMRRGNKAMRRHHNEHFDAHIARTLDQAGLLKDNMLEHYPAEAAEWRSLNDVMNLAQAVSPAAKAASFAHLLQTIMYDGAHAQRHSQAMLSDTDEACWRFDADHAEKHTQGAHEHIRKLARHIIDNYPAEARWLEELMRKEDLSISGQLSAIELGKFHDSWLHEMRDKHGRWTRSAGGAEGGHGPTRVPYEVPPHERLINPRSPYPDPADHPFFKAHPMKAENILHAYSMASDGQKEQGMRWYADAGLVAGAIAHGDQHVGAGLLSAYSPQTSWPINMFNAARSVELGRPLGPGEGATVMQSHANAAKKIMDGQSFEQALPAPKTNAFARLIERKGEDHPDDPFGEVVVDRHALSVAAGERLNDKESTPIGDDRYYQVVADEYRKAAIEASRREGRLVTPSQMQAITWLVQQSANEAQDAAAKQSGFAKGRVTRTANAWRDWIAYAKEHGIETAPGTTALSMLYDPDDALDLAHWEHQLRDAHGRWVRDTLGMHTRNGEITPEREALHRQIVDKILAGHQPSSHPVATFFGGGSASGKSSLHPHVEDSAKIDADAIKGELPEYRDMLEKGDSRAAALTHEESSLIAKKAVAEAERRRLNYVLDGTGDTAFDKMAAKVVSARRSGYGVHAKYVTVDTEEAVRRAKKRAERTGRMVPETTIRAIHSSVSDTLAEALDKKLFDSVQLLDNNGPSARTILVQDASGRHVLDPAAYDRFLAKGGPSGYAAKLRGPGHPPAAGLAGGTELSASGGAGHTSSASTLGQPGGRDPLHEGSRDRSGRALGSQRGLTAQYLDLAFNPAQLRDPRGRWTTSGGLLSHQVHPEGFSLHPRTGQSPPGGYMVALPGHTHQYPDTVMKDEKQLAAAIDETLMAERVIFKNNPNVYLGGWVSDGKLWLDPSENIADRDHAVKLGRSRDQVAIWDVQGGQEIDTGGTGGAVTEHAAPLIHQDPGELRRLAGGRA